jgi:hypothetical protein
MYGAARDQQAKVQLGIRALFSLEASNKGFEIGNVGSCLRFQAH